MIERIIRLIYGREQNRMNSKRPPARQRPAPRTPNRIRPTYTEEEKIAAVSIMVQAGGLRREAIAIARQIVKGNPSESTLFRWWLDYYDRVVQSRPEIVPSPIDIGAIVDQTRDILLPKMKSIITKLMNRLDDDDVIKSATFRDTAIAFGILHDKLENMLTLSPEELAVWRRFVSACNRANYPHLTALEDYIEELETPNQPGTAIAIQARQ